VSGRADLSRVKGQSYPAARTVAPKVHAHFARHLAAMSEEGLKGPDVGAIEAMIDAAFWASLRREEGYAPKISLALVPPDRAGQPLLFERPLPLEPGALARVAPAVERAGIHLGVWHQDAELYVWGTTRTIPLFSLVLEVAAPGLLVVKHHRGGESGKFVNVAVLEGDQIKMVDERASSLPDCPDLVTSLLGFASRSTSLQQSGNPRPGMVEPVNLLIEIAVSMRAHGRGGALLLVPAGSDGWRESIVRPIPYAVSPAYAELAHLNRARPDVANPDVANPDSQSPDPQRPPRPRHATDAIRQGGTAVHSSQPRVPTPPEQPWQETVSRAVEAVAGLTAVDGAAVMTMEYELLAFGAKIARRKGSPQVEQVVLTEPIEGGAAVVVHPGQLGGTRHLSAAQFAHDQHDSVALVASQDGRFTVFAWSPCEAMVHAHRVEALLL
jgi:hypothetical protein